MKLFWWLGRLGGMVGFGAQSDRAAGGLPPDGAWVNPDDPAIAEEVRAREAEIAASQRREELGKKTLTELLAMFRGDLAKALEAKSLTDGEPAEKIFMIGDAMMRGDLTDAEFAQLARLPNLQRILLRDIRLTDRGLAALAKMPQVEGLLLEGPYEFGLSDGCFVHIAKLPGLRELSLDKMRMDGSGLAALKRKDTLRELRFTRCPIDDEGLAQIAQFTQLEDLRLQGTQVTDRGLRILTRLRALRELDLSENAITNAGIQALVSLPALEELDLVETKVTDGCADSLLAMPSLKRVVFGNRQVSVAVVERLRARGIEVEHGDILGLHRDSNVLRYVGTDYEVNREQSALYAFLSPGCESITWRLEIQCTNAYIPQYTQPAYLKGPPMTVPVKAWRELAGQEVKIVYDDAKMHPIMPDNPCNIYIGYHAFPNRHRIKFLKRTGNCFLIEWHCDAKEGGGNFEGDPVYVLAEISFREVVVWSDEKSFSADQAGAISLAHFDQADLGPPEAMEVNFGCQFRFPVLSARG